jgi:hypothetical protein
MIGQLSGENVSVPRHRFGRLGRVDNQHATHFGTTAWGEDGSRWIAVVTFTHPILYGDDCPHALGLT